MTTHTTNHNGRTSMILSVVSGTSAVILALAGPGYSAELPASLAGKASDALVTLATTGNPDPLRTEIGGTVISSTDLQKRATVDARLANRSRALRPCD